MAYQKTNSDSKKIKAGCCYLLLVTSYLYSNVDDWHTTLCAFLDIENAFVTANYYLVRWYKEKTT